MSIAGHAQAPPACVIEYAGGPRDQIRLVGSKYEAKLASGCRALIGRRHRDPNRVTVALLPADPSAHPRVGATPSLPAGIRTPVAAAPPVFRMIEGS